MSLKGHLRHWSDHRQCLGKRGTSVQRVLKAVIGMYSSHPSGPLSLLARVKAFSAKESSKLETDRLALRPPLG
jgi:hypothetical protein